MIFKDLSYLFVSIYYRTPFYKGPAEVEVGAARLACKSTQGPHFLMRFSVFSKFVNPHNPGTPEVGRAQST
jgi:hypothetical protein